MCFTTVALLLERYEITILLLFWGFFDEWIQTKYICNVILNLNQISRLHEDKFVITGKTVNVKKLLIKNKKLKKGFKKCTISYELNL